MRQYDVRTELPMSEWLALGDSATPAWLARRFHAEDTQCIRLGKGVTVEIDGKRYGPGEYVWDRQ